MRLSCRALIVTSQLDSAGKGIVQALLNLRPFELVEGEFDGNPIYRLGDIMLATTHRQLMEAEHLDEAFDCDYYIFASRHSSEKGIPSLTAHLTGNLGPEANLGGREREVAPAPPSLFRSYLRALWARRGRIPNKYRIVTEATHHGPTSLTKPLLFIEIGSSREEWEDGDAALVVAEALLEALKGPEPCTPAIGLGGGHYSEKMTRCMVEGEYGFAALISKHLLPYLDDEMLGQILRKSQEPVRYAVLDWKGLGGEKARILELLARWRLEVIRV